MISGAYANNGGSQEHSDSTQWEIAIASDRGNNESRPLNEDSVAFFQFHRILQNNIEGVRVAIVCDGMGGHDRGEVASGLAIQKIVTSIVEKLTDPSHLKTNDLKFHENVVAQAITIANDKIVNDNKMNQARGKMGTTLVLAYVWKDHLIMGNVGDSRLYFYDGKDGNFIQMSRDDSTAQDAYERGDVADPDDFPDQNTITKVLGIFPEIEPQIEALEEFHEKRYIILSSDGLHGYLKKDMIKKILDEDEGNLVNTCQKLIDAVKRYANAPDNITIALMRFPLMNSRTTLIL